VTDGHARGLLDTSFLVASEGAESRRDAPGLGAVSAITIAELAAGVELATDLPVFTQDVEDFELMDRVVDRLTVVFV
jgi:predicted nucleic acid-binding protein